MTHAIHTVKVIGKTNHKKVEKTGDSSLNNSVAFMSAVISQKYLLRLNIIYPFLVI